MSVVSARVLNFELTSIGPQSSTGTRVWVAYLDRYRHISIGASYWHRSSGHSRHQRSVRSRSFPKSTLLIHRGTRLYSRRRHTLLLAQLHYDNYIRFRRIGAFDYPMPHSMAPKSCWTEVLHHRNTSTRWHLLLCFMLLCKSHKHRESFDCLIPGRANISRSATN